MNNRIGERADINPPSGLVRIFKLLATHSSSQVPKNSRLCCIGCASVPETIVYRTESARSFGMSSTSEAADGVPPWLEPVTMTYVACIKRILSTDYDTRKCRRLLVVWL